MPINWVELKTAQEIYDQKSAINFDRKLLRIWAQSFLLGVPKVIVGFRSEEGTLLRIEEIDTKTIPGRVRRNSRHSANPMWDANICIDMTSSFLNCTYMFYPFFLKMSMSLTNASSTRVHQRTWCVENLQEAP